MASLNLIGLHLAGKTISFKENTMNLGTWIQIAIVVVAAEKIYELCDDAS